MPFVLEAGERAGGGTIVSVESDILSGLLSSVWSSASEEGYGFVVVEVLGRERRYRVRES